MGHVDSSGYRLEPPFFTECIKALAEQRYRDALEALKIGLNEAIQVADRLDLWHLTQQFLNVVSFLEFNLQKAYGDRWEERIPPMPEERQILRCSFCGRDQSAVAKLIAGPKVYICNECVGICNEILETS